MSGTLIRRSLHHAYITYGKFLEILESYIPDPEDSSTWDRPGIPSVSWVLRNPDIRRLDITWKESQPADGRGRRVLGVVGRKGAGHRIIFMLEGGVSALQHMHAEGEFIHIVYGAMRDVNAQGETVVLKTGRSMVHGWASQHQPAQPTVVEGDGTGSYGVLIGFHDQPGGFTLINSSPVKTWTPRELAEEEKRIIARSTSEF